MTADRKPPTGPPPSAGVLARHAQAYARELGVAEGRVRTWVSYMILAGVLERATDAGSPQFIVKGVAGSEAAPGCDPPDCAAGPRQGSAAYLRVLRDDDLQHVRRRVHAIESEHTALLPRVIPRHLRQPSDDHAPGA